MQLAVDLDYRALYPSIEEGRHRRMLVAPLRDGGCSEGQGFRFSEAVPQEEAMRLLGGGVARHAAA